jgi:hypothetical protein
MSSPVERPPGRRARNSTTRGTSRSGSRPGPIKVMLGLAACCATADQDHEQSRGENSRVRPRNKYSRACSCRTPLPRTYYSTHSHTPPPGTPSALSPCCSNSADNRRIRAAERRLHAKRSGQRVTQYRGGVHIPHNFVNNPGCTTPHAAIPYTHPTNPAVNTSPLSHPRVDTLTHTHHTTPLRSTPRPRRTAARLGPFPPSHLLSHLRGLCYFLYSTARLP